MFKTDLMESGAKYGEALDVRKTLCREIWKKSCGSVAKLREWEENLVKTTNSQYDNKGKWKGRLKTPWLQGNYEYKE
jgi:hypothetical protein